jgi:hypothetical protein
MLPKAFSTFCRDPDGGVVVVKMMGDTSVATVNRHYFN